MSQENLEIATLKFEYQDFERRESALQNTSDHMVVHFKGRSQVLVKEEAVREAAENVLKEANADARALVLKKNEEIIAEIEENVVKREWERDKIRRQFEIKAAVLKDREWYRDELNLKNEKITRWNISCNAQTASIIQEHQRLTQWEGELMHEKNTNQG